MKKLLLVGLIVLLMPMVQAVDVHVFYGQGCPHCAAAIADLSQEEVNLVTYEVYFNDTARTLFAETMAHHNQSIDGVPTIIINDTVFIGYNQLVGQKIMAIADNCGECVSRIGNSQEQQTSLTIPAVLAASLVDAINPCAFAVLIILLTTILASKRKKALAAGLAFSLSIFISYFLMGLGLYSAVQATGITHTFFIIVGILAIVIGLFNLKDYFWYGKWFVMEVPMKWRPKLKALIKGVTSVPGAFLIGFAVSLFLLPCTSGPYIVILGLLAKTATKQYALFLLLLYNLVFILPMVIITLAVYFGFTSTEKAEEWRQGKLKILHLIAGLIMLALGVALLVLVPLGIV